MVRGKILAKLTGVLIILEMRLILLFLVSIFEFFFCYESGVENVADKSCVPTHTNARGFYLVQLSYYEGWERPGFSPRAQRIWSTKLPQSNSHTFLAKIFQKWYISDTICKNLARILDFRQTCQILADQTFLADGDVSCKILAGQDISCKILGRILQDNV